jgi:hypothetical protein
MLGKDTQPKKHQWKKQTVLLNFEEIVQLRIEEKGTGEEAMDRLSVSNSLNFLHYIRVYDSIRK